MEVKAIHRFARLSAQKGRLIADMVRNMPVQRAVNALTFSRKRSAKLVLKVLQSAIANAENNEGADIDELKISAIFVDEGPHFKRWHARAKGRGARIIKRTCHITVEVSDAN